MDISEIMTAIINLGFPCVMCILLLKYIERMQTGLIESINALRILVEEVRNKIERD